MLIKLTDPYGDALYLNPASVVAVRTTDSTTTSVKTIEGCNWIVLESAADVCALLLGDADQGQPYMVIHVHRRDGGYVAELTGQGQAVTQRFVSAPMAYPELALQELSYQIGAIAPMG